MSLRSGRERIFQTLTFEALGLAIVTPAHTLLTQTRPETSAQVVIALAVIVTLWSPVFNTIFDRVDLALSGRVASDRSHRLRLVHAVLLELTALVVTLPLVMSLAGYGLREALVFNMALTFFYTVYAYVFYMAYDRLRPVTRAC